MDTEKLKALALAAPEGPWTFGTKYVAKPANGCYSYIAQCPDGTEDTPAWEAVARFIAAANSATVLELIAEVDRLRAELQVSLDVAARQNIAAAKVMRERDGSGSAPAAGIDQDAGRYRLMRAQLSSGDLDYYALEGEPQSFIDEYCDAEIEAHTKAGKEPT